MIEMVDVDKLLPDPSNPRTPDPVRLHLLSLSLSKLGFILPIAINERNEVLSGHQRLTVSINAGVKQVPCMRVVLNKKDQLGINVMFNRVTNDFGALDTGSAAMGKLTLSDIVEKAESLPDRLEPDKWPVLTIKEKNIAGIGRDASEHYDKKAVVAANNMIRKDIKIPIVVSKSGEVVNGIHRLFAAKEAGLKTWPLITIPDELADFALHFLNYLSMDYHVDAEFADLLRSSAYRRPQNNRGAVPKAYRFWANGERTLPDKDSYSVDYWRTFRELHGQSVLDFGAGLCKVAPYLQTKGINCTDFEPFRINPARGDGKPDPDYSRRKAKEFLDTVAEGQVFDSIFLASVLNSVPFPQDRMCVLAIVHALSGYSTKVYGTCRDISDFHYEYGGIRQANYFVFDSEPGVRLGDSLHNPKIQKFHSQEEMKHLLGILWAKADTWSGGNVFYWRAGAPKRVNPAVLSKALDFEFDLPYADSSRMALATYAKKSFSKRLGVKIP